MENEDKTKNALTESDFMEFLSATSEARWQILLAHAEKNERIIEIKKLQRRVTDDISTDARKK